MLRWKTEMTAVISYADGSNRITRRVWMVDHVLSVKIEGEWKKLEWYTDSDDYNVKLLYD